MGVRLLPRDDLIVTNDLDKADWNYRKGVLGSVSRQRFSMIVRLLGETSVGSVLEIGCAGGIFLPELAHHAETLYGCDVHGRFFEVGQRLARVGVTAHLNPASATALPYRDNVFDVIVTVSTLEFIEDLERACAEMARVLKPDGKLLVVTPGHSVVLDLGLALLTGEHAEDTFQGRRQRIIPTLRKYFEIDARQHFPRFVPDALRLYTALQLRPAM